MNNFTVLIHVVLKDNQSKLSTLYYLYFRPSTSYRLNVHRTKNLGIFTLYTSIVLSFSFNKVTQ